MRGGEGRSGYGDRSSKGLSGWMLVESGYRKEGVGASWVWVGRLTADWHGGHGLRTAALGVVGVGLLREAVE